MYTSVNFKTKKALKEAVAAGQEVRVFQPGPFGENEPKDGEVFLEGPHFPAPHTWYARAVVKDGVGNSICTVFRVYGSWLGDFRDLSLYADVVRASLQFRNFHLITPKLVLQTVVCIMKSTLIYILVG